MVGSAVAMMVWFSAARNAASISPKKILRTSAWLIGAGGLRRRHRGGAARRDALGDAAAPAADAQSHAGARPRRRSGKIHRVK